YYGAPSPASTVPGSQPVSVDVRGCSGPRDGDYTFDDLATNTTFRVEALPSGLHRVNYDCTFVDTSGATQHATGYFDYTPSSGAASGSTSPSSGSVDVVGV